MWLRLRWPLTIVLTLTLGAGILLRFDISNSSQLQIASGDAISHEVGHEGFLPDGRIDLNTASVDLLMTLPGVGPATAEEIVRARSERPFASLTELDECCALSASEAARIQSLAGVQ